MKTKGSVTFKSLLKRHPTALDRINRVKRFPIQEPTQILVETTDWHLQPNDLCKRYPGAASFMLAAKD